MSTAAHRRPKDGVLRAPEALVPIFKHVYVIFITVDQTIKAEYGKRTAW